MASIQRKGRNWYCQFCYHSLRHTFTIGRVSEDEARAKSAQVDYLLMRLKQRLVELPSGVDIVAFVQYDGKPPASSVGPVDAPSRQSLTLGALRDRYLATHEGAKESNTLDTKGTHFRHLVATLGERFPVAELRSTDLQQHVGRRVKESIAAVTVRKEVGTLRTAWNWAQANGLLVATYPDDGLVYPKTDEKPPFQTREEIERQIRRGGLTQEEQDELWECLFLTLPDIAELLQHVRVAARHAWIYPMVAFAAHTGARRAEILRARIDDVDFEGETILIREMKRQKGRRTNRRAPLSPLLAGVLRQWLNEHPGGQYLFCHAFEVARSRNRSTTTGHKGEKTRASSLKGRLTGVRNRERPPSGPLSGDESHDHFKRTLAGSKWEVMRGWHVLRHSFISCCAAAGVDQRLIDEWVGHTTEEMRRRYRHLIPSVQKQAIRSVFGNE
jgi:integrase